MTLLRKSYSPGIEGGGIPDEVRIEKAYQLLVNKSNKAYLSSGSFSASPFGLDGIPHVRRDAISKLMVEFSDSELSFASEELARLKEENERLRGSGWLDISTNILPLETQLLIKHKYGIDAIQFHSGKWRYWYSGAEIKKEIIETAKMFLIVDD